MWYSAFIMKIFQCIIIVLTLFFTPILRLQAAQISSGAEVSLIQEEAINQNVYIAGGTVIIDTPVSGDVTIVGGTVIIKNTINGDVMIAGGDVTIESTVTGDVRVVGGTVTLNSTIHGDFASLGGNIFTKESSVIRGQALLIGGTLSQEGTLNGVSKILVGKTILNGKINGPIEITTQQITFKSKLIISNQLAYFAPEKGFEESGSNLGETVTFNQIQSIRENGLIKQAFLNFINFWILLRFITTLLLSFILVSVFRVFSQRTTDFALDSFWKSLLIGFLFIAFMPLVAVLLAVSLIAIPFAILLSLTYFMIMIVGGAVAGIVVGTLLKQAVSKSDKNEIDFQTATFGVVLLTLVQFVPFIGDFTRILFFIVAVGSIVHYIYMNIRWRKIS